MTDTRPDASSVQEYHAHIYYDPADRAAAADLRAAIEARFPTARMGRWHDVPVGPHPQAMYQVAFKPDLFATLAPFLMLNRAGLTVLLHPETGRPRDDHTRHATWMGAVLPIKAETLPETD
ncbi:MAG: DOPA 4,5-dioxygenase family protein [Rhodospirillales bacterium]|nr:DOPA 4,5-dioxygenase family protein [Rhodospirillales bacterium]